MRLLYINKKKEIKRKEGRGERRGEKEKSGDMNYVPLDPLCPF